MYGHINPKIAPGGNLPVWGEYNPSKIVNDARKSYTDKGFLKKRRLGERTEKHKFELTSLMALEGALTPQVINAIAGYGMFGTRDQDWLRDRGRSVAANAPVAPVRVPQQDIGGVSSDRAMPRAPPATERSRPSSEISVSTGEMRSLRHEQVIENRRQQQANLYQVLEPAVGPQGAEHYAREHIDLERPVTTSEEKSEMPSERSESSRKSSEKSVKSAKSAPLPKRRGRGAGKGQSRRAWESENGKYKSSEHDNLSWGEYKSRL